MKLDIMGLQFDNVTMDEASARAEQILAGKKTCYAVTPNAEIAYEALYDETLRALINGADLVLPDGAGVVLASKLLKTPLKQKVAGVDFADRLLSILEKTGGGLFLLGSKPGVAELAAQIIGNHLCCRALVIVHICVDKILCFRIGMREVRHDGFDAHTVQLL